MVQSLLADRLSLRLRKDMREMPVYVLRGSLRAVAMQWSRVWFAISLDRPVIDRTGLSGQFDIELTWTEDTLASPAGAEIDSVSLPTALREQLGLKLEPAKAPIEVMVVEHVHLPSED